MLTRRNSEIIKIAVALCGRMKKGYVICEREGRFWSLHHFLLFFLDKLFFYFFGLQLNLQQMVSVAT